ncbi:histidine--tRNA ligase [Candidatus Electronema sp. JM]|uniref:histidine--tRNA ligase n=1 Tax=Candidatus Electronema sp. JM TaxID=3401571 RepID=UPI003AA7EF2B
MKFQTVNGFKDILPDEALRWQQLEQTARSIFRRFGLREIRLPLLEPTGLFARSIGEGTDIVDKEMYTFADKGLTLRPEATASIARAYVEHGLHVQQPVQRLFTIGPMFRHERPQKGRLRQFHQIDAEIIGAAEPAADAELMAMAQLLLDELGLKASLEINSIGCPQCRPGFRAQLVQYVQERSGSLCEDCQRRCGSNPLRVLDCKNRSCKETVQNAPSILDSLCDDCAAHFAAVRRGLDDLGVRYSLNRFMVRGLDYYVRTTFEFTTTELGAQSAVGGGGRYDCLIEELGGPKNTPGLGFGLGMERLVLLLEQRGEEFKTAVPRADLYAAALGGQAAEFALPLVHAVRRLGFAAAIEHGSRSLKAQMKQADRVKARFTLIIGEQELERREAMLRNMDSQEQSAFSLQGTAAELAERLGKVIAGVTGNTANENIP